MAQAPPSNASAKRARTVRAAARLLWTRGFHRTALKQVLADSNTPRGSVYFHFPKGKVELALEAVKVAEGVIRNELDQAFQEATVERAVAQFVAGFARRMEEARFDYGCPMGTATIEAVYWSEEIRAVCDRAFREWEARLHAGLRNEGMVEEEAASLAALTVCTIEGAVILSQARRSADPLYKALQALQPLLGRA